MTAVFQHATAGQNILLMADFSGVGNAYVAPMSLTLTKGITLTTNVNSTEIYRTDNLSAPGLVWRGAKSLDSSITGQGTLDVTDYASWANYQQTGKAIPVKFVVNPTTDDAGLPTDFGNTVTNAVVFTGAYIISSFKLSANTHDLATADVTLDQAGPLTISISAPVANVAID